MDEYSLMSNSSNDDFKTSLKKVKDLLTKNNIPEAKEILLLLKESHNDNLEVNFILSQIHEMEEEFDKALECYIYIQKAKPDYENTYKLAQLYEEADKPEDAYENYKKCYELSSKDTNILERVAHAARILGKNNEAIEFYEKIKKRQPDDIVAITQLMELYEDIDKYQYYVLRAQFNELEEKPSYAIDSYKKALKNASEDTDTTVIKDKVIDLLIAENKFKEAVSVIQSILDEKPELKYIKQLSKVYLELDSQFEAKETLERYIEEDIYDDEIVLSLAELYFDDEDFEEVLALEDSFNKENKSYSILKSRTLIELDELSKAKEIIENLLSKNAKDFDVIDVYVDLLIKGEETQKAVEMVEKLKKIKPNSSIINHKMAKIFEKTNDEFNLHYNLAKHHEAKKEMDLAIDEYLWAHNLEPENADVVLKLAQIYENKKEEYYALEFYEKAFNIDESILSATKAGYFHFKNKDYETAIVYFESVLAKKKDLDVMLKAAKCYEKLRNIPKAIEYYEFYLQKSPSALDSEEIKLKLEKLKSKEFVEEDEGLIEKILGFFK